MATKKTRVQLQTESDATFLDNSSGQIIPENHRIYNDNVAESAAILNNENIFEEENTFYRTIISEVASEENALSSEEGYIILTNGGLQVGGPSTFSQTIQSDVADDTNALSSNYGNIYLQNGDLDVGGQTNLNTTLIKVLQNAFKTTPITASSTLDLSATDGNLIYIEGDATIDSFSAKVGQVFYAIFTGTCLWDCGLGNIQPPTTFKTFPNDVLIFSFITDTTIRVFALYRNTDEANVQLNGQNYFQINLPQDALDLATQNCLAVGATYRVLGAFEMPKMSGIYYDVYLRASTPSTYEPTCYLSNTTDQQGVLQKAFFTGSFATESIFVIETLDSTNGISWAQALINGDGGSLFALGGAKSFIEDPDVGFYGDATFRTNGYYPISQNLLDIQDSGKFGRIMDAGITPAPSFISHSAFGNAGTILFGTNWYTIGLPSNGAINTAWTALYSSPSSPTLITYYRVQYKVVNDICTLDFYATLTGFFDKNVASPRELWAILPTPFSIAADSIFSTGSVRISSGNHQDQGLLCEAIPTNQQYFKITSKHNNALSTIQSVIMSGSISFQITA